VDKVRVLRLCRTLFVNCWLCGYMRVKDCIYKCNMFRDVEDNKVVCYDEWNGEYHRLQISVSCPRRGKRGFKYKRVSIDECENCKYFQGVRLKDGVLVCTYHLAKYLDKVVKEV